MPVWHSYTCLVIVTCLTLCIAACGHLACPVLHGMRKVMVQTGLSILGLG